jgi:hypothetical protein
MYDNVFSRMVDIHELRAAMSVDCRAWAVITLWIVRVFVPCQSRTRPALCGCESPVGHSMNDVCHHHGYDVDLWLNIQHVCAFPCGWAAELDEAG